MIFSVKDSLRQAVEAASGGLCTVMYTKKGQPVFLRRIPRFNLEDIDPALGTGPHPAFLVGGEVKSEVWIGMYPGYVSNGELISVPGVAPSAMTFDQAVSYAKAAGPGFHLMTNAEWAAVAFLTWKSRGAGDDPVRGNTQWGRSHEAPWETGVRADGLAPGTTSGDGKTLTGSGPLSWRHDGTPAGIADLVGNVWEWVAGLRLMNGEIQILPNNDAALPNADMSPTSTQWRAIRASDGALVAPGTSGTLKYDIDPNKAYSDDNTAQDLGPVALRTARQTPPAGWGSDTYQDHASAMYKDLVVDTGITVPSLLKALMLAPHTTSITKGRLYARPYGERLPLRGGAWWNGGDAGLAALDLLNPRGFRLWSVGARPAFVL
ncbi:hypothetical protein TthSNM11_13990 [Thermus thermophilus]|uniref:formylglycine-generating enzyme family protein n=1 Tax=Thermus thermophilus TaxID=274 RepID=UPI001FCAE730|nr:formylglycine-generating enzyme family protein [Thermus thermophilus]BDG19196.1 hypothetical protein TthSNM11_13990 [Thermus thermophilus]